tara:strand:- start:79 stop:360 length:282 start_codon:yes stop_codon:yes gene_type:complete
MLTSGAGVQHDGTTGKPERRWRVDASLPDEWHCDRNRPSRRGLVEATGSPLPFEPLFGGADGQMQFVLVRRVPARDIDEALEESRGTADVSSE